MCSSKSVKVSTSKKRLFGFVGNPFSFSSLDAVGRKFCGDAGGSGSASSSPLLNAVGRKFCDDAGGLGSAFSSPPTSGLSGKEYGADASLTV